MEKRRRNDSFFWNEDETFFFLVCHVIKMVRVYIYESRMSQESGVKIHTNVNLKFHLPIMQAAAYFCLPSHL